MRGAVPRQSWQAACAPPVCTGSRAAQLGMPRSLSNPELHAPPAALQLVSLIAYHVCPEGAFTSAQLHAQQDLPTALNNTSLLVGGAAALPG